MKSKGNTKSKGSKSNTTAVVVDTPVVSSSSSRAVVRVQGKEVRVGNTNDWRGLVATFISSQDVKESSRALYTRTLSQYFLWIEQSGKALINLTRQDVLEYKDSLQQQSLSSLTISSYITAVRKFYS